MRHIFSKYLLCTKSQPHAFAEHSKVGRYRRRLLAAAAMLAGTGAGAPARAQRPVYFAYPGPKVAPQIFDFTQVPSWLSWDMELRGRFEGQTSLGERSGNDRVYVLTRARGGLTANFTDFLRGYLQFQDTHALGLPLPQVASNMRDTFDLFQGYLDIHPIDKLDLVTGRQLLRFGRERIVGISDWTNNSRSWDGFDGHYGDKNWIEAFATSVVQVHPTSLDKHGAGLTFYGLVDNLSTVIPRTELQTFLYIRRVPVVASQQGVRGGELENTFGFEANGDLPGGFFYDTLGSLQRGSYSNDFIHSGFGYAKAGYGFPHVAWKPRFTGEYKFASGNTHRDPYRISMFDQQYPSNHNAFGLTDTFGNQNITQSRVDAQMIPAKNWSLLFSGEFQHIVSVQDNVYAGGGTTLVRAPAAGFLHTDLAQGFDASTDYVFRKHLDIQAGVGHLFPGRVLTENGKAPPLTLGYLQLTYRFKVQHQAPYQTPYQAP